jgi:hypothetical protein
MITVELTRREDTCPVQWMDRQAVVALPERIDRFNAAASRADSAGELLAWVVTSVFDAAMSLQAAIELPHDLTAQPITKALGLLDDVVREVRNHVYAEGARG